MTYLDSILLGVVEGVTEFLPISSTGHMILVSKLIGLVQSDFVKSFEIAIQLGAILAVLVLFGKRLVQSREVLYRVCVAFVPTAVVGLALYKVIKTYLFADSVVVWSLLLGGIALVAFEKWHGEKAGGVGEIEKISYKQAAMIGLAQSVAVVPGVSRAAATIVGGLALGVKRTTIVEFSFLLALPTMAAATGLDLLKSGVSFSSDEYTMLAIGFVVAFVTALIVVRWLMRFVQTHDFTWFGWYRIVVALGWFILR